VITVVPKLIAAIAIVVVGGGIQTTLRYWERAAGSVEAQVPRYRERARMQGAGGRARSVDAADQPSSPAPTTEQLRARTTHGSRRPEA
jgi:hypothetical protein